MYKWALWALLACAAAWPVSAQQGHPLSGTWSGSWGAEGQDRVQVVFVMDWDGKAVTGQMNPGPNSAPIKSVQLDPTNWVVKIEADTKDKAGKPVHVSAEGRIENVLSYHRSIQGTWKQGQTTGNFQITRE